MEKKRQKTPNKDPKKPNNSSKRGALQALAVTTTIGTELAVSTTLGFYAGRYIDSKLDTAPIFLIICLLFGLGLGMMAIVKTLEALFKNQE